MINLLVYVFVIVWSASLIVVLHYYTYLLNRHTDTRIEVEGRWHINTKRILQYAYMHACTRLLLLTCVRDNRPPISFTVNRLRAAETTGMQLCRERMRASWEWRLMITGRWFEEVKRICCKNECKQARNGYSNSNRQQWKRKRVNASARSRA